MLPKLLYENILREGTLTASGTSSDDDYNVNYLVDYRSFTKWKAASTSDPYVELELSGAEEPDCLAIYNHNFDEVGGTIKLQHDSDDDDTWTDMETITPNGTKPIMIMIGTPVSSTKFRIFFDTPTTIPEMAIIFLGVAIEFPYPPDSPTVPFDESIRATMEISEAGHNLGAVISHFPISVNQKFSNFTRTWFDTYFKPFWINHARYLLPFFYGWDLTNRADDIFFLTMDENFIFREALTILSLTDELTLQMRGISSDENYIPFVES